MTHQKGFAHAVLIVGLVIAIIGALGFIFWQNFIHEEPVVKNSDNTGTTNSNEAENLKGKLFQTSSYSFEYPATGWRVEEVTQNVDDSDNTTPVAKTDNYKHASGLGLDAGAEVAVNVNKADMTLAEMKTDAQEVQGKIDNLKDLKVAGVDAFTYSSAYEGMRYHTVFIRDGLVYDIVYQYAGDDASVYMKGYEKIYTSFKIK